MSKYILFYSKSKDPKAKHLSNFYPCQIKYKSLIFPSIEHAYQGSKYLFTTSGAHPRIFEQFSIGKEIGSEPAKKAKSAGGKGAFKKHKLRLSPEWDKVQTKIMHSLIKKRCQVDKICHAVEHNIRLLHFERWYISKR